MSRLPVVSGRETVAALQRIGYVVVRQRGSHIRMRHSSDTGRGPVTVPQHRTLKPGTLRAILRDARLSVEQFRELL
ncbi:MAG: type II toxin-antitoxin system HicA family toxin [Phycisphaerae bacterium]